MKSDQNNPENFPSTESIEELDSKDAVKLKKQLLRGSSEKIMMTQYHTNLCYCYNYQMCQSKIGWYSSFHPPPSFGTAV